MNWRAAKAHILQLPRRLARTLWLATVVICGAGMPSSASAHPLAPALLEVKSLGSGSYAVLWRLSAVQRSGIAPQPVFPAHCRAPAEPQYVSERGKVVVARWQIDCGAAGLSEARIRVDGLAGSGINVIARIHTEAGHSVEALLDASEPALTVTQRTVQSVFQRYLGLGVEHLFGGADHVLFVLALVALISGWRRLLVTITAFTLGHSLTLALATLGLVKAHAPLMELGIALSLVVMARELLSDKPSWVRRRPALVAAGFGLLHGLGFAGALSEVGLPGDSIPLALLAFNVGIELAQLLLIAGFLPLLAVLRRVGETASSARLLRLATAYAVGTLAMLWCLQRAGELI